MRFFVDDDHWDIEGYWEQVKTLEPRLSKRAFKLFSTHSFHDAYFISLDIINTYRFLKRSRPVPTIVEIRIVDYMDNYEYTITWHGVSKVVFSFDEKDKIALDDKGNWYFGGENRKGVDSWGFDELTVLDDHYLSHEIEFHSGAKLLLHFKTIDYRRSIKKSDLFKSS